LLKVSPGTVTNTVKRLKRERLITHKAYKGIKITEKGRKIALSAIRKHLSIEKLLTDILHVERPLAYKVAFNIGYYIPDSVVKKD
jgi:DtxR family Mn-dependent transcriptional regulator